MPGLPETMYCSQQIHISPMLPQILKQYAKAAIRTQPTDLLRWSTAYFRALSQNETPPEKKRLEYPEPKNYMGLTPGLLKVLLNQIGKSPNIYVSYVDLYAKWNGICMSQDELIKLLLSAQIDNAVSMPWYKIIAVAAGYLSDNLTQTLVLICNLLTEEPDGGSAMISVDVFLMYYKFLAELNLSETMYMLNVHFYVGFDSEDNQSKEDEKTDFAKISPRTKHSINKSASGILSILSNVPPEFQHIYQDFQDYKPPQKNSIESEGFVVSDQENNIAKETDKKQSVTMSSISDVINTTSETTDEQDLMVPENSDLLTTNGETLETNVEEEKMKPSILSTRTEYLLKDSEDFKDNFTPNLPIDDNYNEVTGMISPYSQVESVTSKLLGKASPHFHLNKYLASGTPSMVTELESRFTTTNVGSETHTIFREHTKGKIKLISKLPNEQVRYQIDEVKGIGPSVDPNTMDTFIKYIEERAAFQHGMIMPRNITSFQCPPLENFKYTKKIEVEESIPFVGCKNVY